MASELSCFSAEQGGFSAEQGEGQSISGKQMKGTGNNPCCLAVVERAGCGCQSLFRRCCNSDLDGLLRPGERYWALEELCQCYPCGLAPFNDRSLDLRCQKGQANEPAPIWRIRSCIEHGQSGIILVQHGVCGAERLDQNRVWPVSRTWALENPGLATTPDKGKMQLADITQMTSRFAEIIPPYHPSRELYSLCSHPMA